MRLGRYYLDGGSLAIALFLALAVVGGLVSDWKQLDTLSVVVAISICAAISSVFIWQSFRIGRNRQRARDTSRWLGDNLDKN